MAARPNNDPIDIIDHLTGNFVSKADKGIALNLFGPGRDGHHDGNPIGPVDPSIMSAQDLNVPTEEICRFVERIGNLDFALDPANYGQLTDVFYDYMVRLGAMNWLTVGEVDVSSNKCGGVWASQNGDIIIMFGYNGIFRSVLGGPFQEVNPGLVAAGPGLAGFRVRSNSGESIIVSSELASNDAYISRSMGSEWVVKPSAIDGPYFNLFDGRWISTGGGSFIHVFGTTLPDAPDKSYLLTQVVDFSPLGSFITDMASSPTKVVAIGYFNSGTDQVSVMESSDIENSASWVRTSFSSSDIATDGIAVIAYGNGRFIAAYFNEFDNTTTIASSIDGGGGWSVNGFQPIQFALNEPMELVFGAGYFYLVGSTSPNPSYGRQIWRSRLGVNWEQIPSPPNHIDFTIYHNGLSLYGAGKDVDQKANSFKTASIPVVPQV